MYNINLVIDLLIGVYISYEERREARGAHGAPQDPQRGLM